MDDTVIQTDILNSIDPEDHNKEDEMEKQETNSEINSKDYWTEKDAAFLKSIGVENVPLKDDGSIDIGKLESHHRMTIMRHRKNRKHFCDICNKGYKNDHSLYSHKNQMHRSIQMTSEKKMRRSNADPEIISCHKESNSNLENNLDENKVPCRIRKVVDYDLIAGNKRNLLSQKSY